MPGPNIPTGGPTLLVLTPISGADAPFLGPYSARGLTQTLQPIFGSGNASGTLIRSDINGNLVDLTSLQFRKWELLVTCSDGTTPCLDGAWLGIVCSVECAAELAYPTGGYQSRPAVAGSLRTEGMITYYRPALTMTVMRIENSFREYESVYNWSIRLEETYAPGPSTYATT
jgi:hypothetical protein